MNIKPIPNRVIRPIPIPGHRTALVVLAAVLLAVVGLGQPQTVVAENAPEVVFPRSSLTIETATGQYMFSVEVADTRARRMQGLQHRQTLAPDAGMLLDYGESREVAMWMKNTHIPLDMLFIDEAGRVARVASNTEPFSLSPISSGEPVKAVLELNAGTARRLDIRPGDHVHHEIFDASAK